jgi:hypothetical protein
VQLRRDDALAARPSSDQLDRPSGSEHGDLDSTTSCGALVRDESSGVTRQSSATVPIRRLGGFSRPTFRTPSDWHHERICP